MGVCVAVWLSVWVYVTVCDWVCVTVSVFVWLYVCVWLWVCDCVCVCVTECDCECVCVLWVLSLTGSLRGVKHIDRQPLAALALMNRETHPLSFSLFGFLLYLHAQYMYVPLLSNVVSITQFSISLYSLHPSFALSLSCRNYSKPFLTCPKARTKLFQRQEQSLWICNLMEGHNMCAVI